MPTFRLYRSYTQYEHGDVEAENEEEARDIEANGDVGFDVDDEENYEIYEVEEILPRNPTGRTTISSLYREQQTDEGNRLNRQRQPLE